MLYGEDHKGQESETKNNTTKNTNHKRCVCERKEKRMTETTKIYIIWRGG